MSRSQRLGLLGVAAVIAVLAIVVIASITNDNHDTGQNQPAEPQSTRPTLQATRAPPDPARMRPRRTARAKPKPPLLRAGSERHLTVTKGDTVRFRVRASSPEEVHVHGYDIKKDLAADTTATLSFKADIEGIFEVELERSGTPLGTIKVEPR